MRIVRCLALCALLLVLLAGCAGQELLQVTYYYESYCESCRADLEFAEWFTKAKGDMLPAEAYKMRYFNVARVGSEGYDADCERLGIPEDERKIPALFLGDQAILGTEAIETTLSIELSQLDHGRRDAAYTMPVAGEGESLLLYFYTSPCSSCSLAGAQLDDLPASVPLSEGGETAVRIERHSILDDSGLSLLQACFEAWQVPSADRQVPIVFYSAGYTTENFMQLAPKIEKGDALRFAPPEGSAPLEELSLPAIVAAGLVAGLNPCALSMFLFVLTVAIERKKTLSTLWYVGGHTVAQLVLCLVLTNVLTLLQGAAYQRILTVTQALFAVAALVLAALNIRDFFKARAERYGEIRMQLPVGLRKFNHDVIAKAKAVPGPLWWVALAGLGVLVSGGEFLCTGQVTLATLLYLVRTGSQSMAPLLLFVVLQAVPMTAAALLLHAGQKVYNLAEGARKAMPLAKLANAALFIAFAIYFLVSLR